MGRVSGKVAIITGGAGGMGAMHARRLVAEGAKVMITDLQERAGLELAEALGDNVRFLRHDVTDEVRWHQVVRETEAAFGPVSVLVNNAGIGGGGAIETTDEADFRRVIDVDLVSVFLGMKAAIPSLKRAGGGSIINISSIAGLVGSTGTLAYTAAKFGVRGMTKSAAIELSGDKIRVNSVHPGLIRTPLIALDGANGDTVAQAIKGIPAGRIAEPDEVSGIILYLASDESSYATGAEFVIDGGFSSQ